MTARTLPGAEERIRELEEALRELAGRYHTGHHDLAARRVPLADCTQPGCVEVRRVLDGGRT